MGACTRRCACVHACMSVHACTWAREAGAHRMQRARERERARSPPCARCLRIHAARSPLPAGGLQLCAAVLHGPAQPPPVHEPLLQGEQLAHHQRHAAAAHAGGLGPAGACSCVGWLGAAGWPAWVGVVRGWATHISPACEEARKSLGQLRWVRALEAPAGVRAWLGRWVLSGGGCGAGPRLCHMCHSPLHASRRSPGAGARACRRCLAPSRAAAAVQPATRAAAATPVAAPNAVAARPCCSFARPSTPWSTSLPSTSCTHTHTHNHTTTQPHNHAQQIAEVVSSVVPHPGAWEAKPLYTDAQSSVNGSILVLVVGTILQQVCGRLVCAEHLLPGGEGCGQVREPKTCPTCPTFAPHLLPPASYSGSPPSSPHFLAGRCVGHAGPRAVVHAGPPLPLPRAPPPPLARRARSGSSCRPSSWPPRRTASSCRTTCCACSRPAAPAPPRSLWARPPCSACRQVCSLAALRVWGRAHVARCVALLLLLLLSLLRCVTLLRAPRPSCLQPAGWHAGPLAGRSCRLLLPALRPAQGSLQPLAAPPCTSHRSRRALPAACAQPRSRSPCTTSPWRPTSPARSCCR